MEDGGEATEAGLPSLFPDGLRTAPAERVDATEGDTSLTRLLLAVRTAVADDGIRSEKGAAVGFLFSFFLSGGFHWRIFIGSISFFRFSHAFFRSGWKKKMSIAPE